MAKKLPIGIQSFVEIRSEPWYYVDKTYFVKKLVDSGKYFFLSRPRRFGKSLFLDTLRQAFLGRKELFKGLFLEHHWEWDVKYPVIYISFGSGVIFDAQHLLNKIDSFLLDINKLYEIDYEKKCYEDKFFEAIKKIAEKYDKKVVVLIDEYDKPILDCIENKDEAIKIRETLKNFYSVLKDADPYLKFVFITGVSKFSKVSIFSGLNQLNDITLDPQYATICGYTQKELEETFADRLSEIDLKKIKCWYNGYSWLGEPVYNPFDVLLYLSQKRFRPYWFETGTPSFLIKIMAERKYYLPKLEKLKAGEDLIGNFDIDTIYPENLLFQTGYLTIKECIDYDGKIAYLLSFPNKEVKISFSNYFLNYLTENYYEKDEIQLSLRDAIKDNDFEKIKNIFQSFFASIPYEWYRKNELAGYEGYYASVVYAYFAGAGFDVVAEDTTSKGKIDLSVFYQNCVYIIEFKVVEFEPPGSALEQIKKKAYFKKYLNQAEEIYLIGVEFSKKERNIINFEWERVK